MSQARQQKRQVWILDALIAIWDAEALKAFREQDDFDYGCLLYTSPSPRD